MMRRALIAALVLLVACSGEKPAAPNALSLAVEPQGQSAVQQFELPAAAIVALQRADRGDLRLLDGRGKPVPLALNPVNAPEEYLDNGFIPNPIAQTSEDVKLSAVSIDLAEPGGFVTISTNGQPLAKGRKGVLLDTRDLEYPASSIDLGATLPEQTPVTFTLETSNDLKSWQPLAEKVLYAPQGGTEVLGKPEVDLGGVILAKQIVRISWDEQYEVSFSKVFVLTSKIKPVPLLAVATKGAELDDAHNLRFSAPLAAPLAGIELRGADADGVVPVRIYGRDTPERGWNLLGVATLRQTRTARIELGAAQAKEYRIEADSRSAGFSVAPAITLLLDRVDVIAAFNGQPPYRLTIGDAKAAPKFFQPADLREPGSDAAKIPVAKLEQAAPPLIALGPAGNDSPYSPRKLWLWAALLAATAVLGFAAIRLLRTDPVIADEPTAPTD